MRSKRIRGSEFVAVVLGLFVGMAATGVRAGEWSPQELTDSQLALWLDAADLETVQQDAGGVVQWDDKSGLSHHAAQGSEALQPGFVEDAGNGNPAVRFAAGQRLDIADVLAGGTAGRSIFIVARTVAKDANQSILALNSTAPGTALARFLYITPEIWVRVSGNQQFDKPMPDEAFGILTVGNAAGATVADIYGYLDGHPLTSVETTHGEVTLDVLGNDASIGGNIRFGQAWEGDIAELLVFASELPPEDSAQVEGYLAHKWGLQESLPEEHPYAELPPLAGVWVHPSFHELTPGWGETRFATIQSAIDAAESGATIHVAAGTYVENLTIPDGLDGLTLLGANAGISVGANPGTRGPESVLEGQISSGSGGQSGWSEDLKVDGFTIEAARPFNALRTQGRIEIVNNILDGLNPERTGGGNFLVTFVNANTYEPWIAGNLFKDARFGVLYTGANLTGGTIRDNAFVNLLKGIELGGNLSSIIGNLFNDNERGIVFTSNVHLNTNIRIAHNRFEDNTVFAVENEHAETVYAPLNWWGADSGPAHTVNNPDGQGDPVSDRVVFEPWFDAASYPAWMKPDFVVDAITLDPAQPEAGQAVTATVTVRNKGNIPGDAGTLRVWASKVETAAAGELGDAQVYVGALDRDESTTVTLALTAPAEAGTHLLRAYVDADDDTPEKSDNNNQKTLTYTLAGAASWQKPDFIISSMEIRNPDMPELGGQFQIKVVVENKGDTDGDAGVVHFWASEPYGEEEALVSSALGTLEPGETAIRTRVVNAPAEPGTYLARAEVVTATPEKSDGNNHKTVTYTLHAALPDPDPDPEPGHPSWMKPDFVVTEIALDPVAPPEPGESFDVTVTVWNKGDIGGDAGILRLWASKSEVAETEEPGDVEEALGLLAADAATNVTLTLTAPDDMATHLLRAFVDADDITEEKSEGNNQKTLTYVPGSFVEAPDPDPDPDPEPVWTPTDLGSDHLVLWLDAADEGTVHLDQDRVAQWDDKSGQGYHAAQGVSGMRPEYPAGVLSGNPVMRFDLEQRLDIAGVPAGGTVGRTVFVVTKTVDNHLLQPIVALNSTALESDDPARHFYITPEIWVRVSGNRQFAESAPKDAFGIIVAANPTDATVDDIYGFLDGVALTASGSVHGGVELNITGNDTSVGGSISYNGQPWEGDVAEVLVFAEELSADQRAQIEGYLAHKWGLTGRLEETHPYKYDPPAIPDPDPDPDPEYPSWMKPDFVVTEVVLDPAAPALGQPFTATVTVLNKGDLPGDAGTLRVWAATGADPVDEVIGELVVDATATRTFALTAPDAAGTYQVRAFADAYDVTAEKSEGNNQKTATYTLHAAPDPDPDPDPDPGYPSWMKPDFVVKDVVLTPFPGVVGDVFTATVTVKNQGDLPGDAGDLGLWIARGPTAAQPGEMPDRSATVGLLDVDETVDVVFANLPAPEASGTYHCRAFIDVNNITDEKSEGNNQKTRAYTLYDVRLLITPVPEGMKLEWNSRSGWVYTIERTADLGEPFQPYVTGIEATPPKNLYIDTEVPAGGAYYRIQRGE